ncbi:hypothetical protein MTO96_016518 [Rhipicephalus appendiculatus]
MDITHKDGPRERTVPWVQCSKGEKGKPKYLALDINNIYKGKSLENPKTSAAPQTWLAVIGESWCGEAYATSCQPSKSKK